MKPKSVEVVDFKMVFLTLLLVKLLWQYCLVYCIISENWTPEGLKETKSQNPGLWVPLRSYHNKWLSSLRPRSLCSSYLSTRRHPYFQTLWLNCTFISVVSELDTSTNSSCWGNRDTRNFRIFEESLEGLVAPPHPLTETQKGGMGRSWSRTKWHKG